MRILGLDIGSKTIGVAVSDPLGWTAQGLTTVQRKKPGDDLQQIAELARNYEATEIVVGLPLNMNGTKGPAAALAEEFGSQLQKQTGLPITYRDERLSTVAAERTLLAGDISRRGRKKVIDKLAAVIILQGYLDYLGHSNRKN